MCINTCICIILRVYVGEGRASHWPSRFAFFRMTINTGILLSLKAIIWPSWFVLSLKGCSIWITWPAPSFEDSRNRKTLDHASRVNWFFWMRQAPPHTNLYWSIIMGLYVFSIQAMTFVRFMQPRWLFLATRSQELGKPPVFCGANDLQETGRKAVSSQWPVETQTSSLALVHCRRLQCSYSCPPQITPRKNDSRSWLQEHYY